MHPSAMNRIPDTQHEWWDEFADRARRLGHDLDMLRSGAEICTYITVPNLEEAAYKLSYASAEQKEARKATFFHESVLARRRLGQGMHDRGEAAVMTGDVMPDSDAHGLGNHLPLHAKVVSVWHKVIPAGQVWDLSVRGDVWGLDDMEELYVTLNVGTLVFEPGATLIVQGNVFSMLCQQMICSPIAGKTACHIGILPTPFSVDGGHGPMDGADGQAGDAGASGQDGKTLMLSQSLLGPVLQQAVQPGDLNGTNGQNGERGADGKRGRNGGMCKLTELAIRNIDGHLVVMAKGGQGGNGGNGGQGGNGGNGGNGTRGAVTLTAVIPDGLGGSGGQGGDGGQGGNGGNGGLSSNIYINVKPADETKVSRIALPALPGEGGQGGQGGQAGTGGMGVSEQAQDGATGMNGKHGRPGRERPAPAIFLNEKL
ncbi:MAG: hypothetical protein JNM22_14310 [Saprospiraceae bacterium]|nr:hypothetical protein [Saprospiraceae bacterium]